MNIARRSKHIPKPTESLRRAFIPILHLPPCQPNHQQTRLISANRRRFQPTPPSRPRDESINFRQVQLVSEDDSRLLPPEPRSRVLARIDRDEFFLVQVAGPPESIHPICKVISKREEREHDKRKVSTPKQAAGSKELELNWNIGPNDLRRKMEWLKEFLEEGRTVEIDIKRRKRWMNPSANEVKTVEDSIKAAVEGVAGTTELRPKEEVQVIPMQKKNVRCYFKGPMKKQQKTERMDEKESRRIEKEQEMEEKKEKRKKRAEERKESVLNIVKANG